MAEKHKAADIYPGSPPPEFEQLKENKIEGINNLENVFFTNINFSKNNKTTNG
jgi:hypothetical protein